MRVNELSPETDGAAGATVPSSHSARVSIPIELFPRPVREKG